jgi:hypothetical protein
VPSSWQLTARVNGEWKLMAPDIEPPVKRDQFSAINFAPVIVDALRIEVQLASGFSGGILEWKVE